MKKCIALLLALCTLNSLQADFFLNNNTGDKIRIDIYYQGESVASCRTDKLTWGPEVTNFKPAGRCNIRAIYVWPADDPTNTRKMATCGKEILSPIGGGIFGRPLGWFINIRKTDNKYKIILTPQIPDKAEEDCRWRLEAYKNKNQKKCSQSRSDCLYEFTKSTDYHSCRDYLKLQKDGTRDMKKCSDLQ